MGTRPPPTSCAMVQGRPHDAAILAWCPPFSTEPSGLDYAHWIPLSSPPPPAGKKKARPLARGAGSLSGCACLVFELPAKALVKHARRVRVIRVNLLCDKPARRVKCKGKARVVCALILAVNPHGICRVFCADTLPANHHVIGPKPQPPGLASTLSSPVPPAVPVSFCPPFRLRSIPRLVPMDTLVNPYFRVFQGIV